MPKEGYKVVRSLKARGWPTVNKSYHYAHELADKAEKKKYRKSYERMKQVDAKLKKGELAGKNTRSGKIKVSAKVPAKYRQEVAYHERKEYKILSRKNRNRS